MKKNVLIIGAGASGLLCATEAARRGRSVLVIDHMKAPGNKILVSGGGRCNFTNLSVTQENYVSGNRHFCRSALAQFRPEDFLTLLARHNIAYREKSDGQLFCRRSSQDVLTALKKDAGMLGVDMSLSTTVKKVRKNGLFEVLTSRGVISAESLVVATGGLSFPELGASGLGYAIAKEFGLEVNEMRPGLVPLKLDKKTSEQFGVLSGTSLDVEVSCGKARFSGSMLITHTGLSGPPVLQISLYWREGDVITVNLLPGMDALHYLLDRHGSKALVPNLLSEFLPKRFINQWAVHKDIARPLCQLTHADIKRLAYDLHNWRLRPAGTEGYSRAEVTVGGVDCNGLSSRTMEAKKVPGLFFIGEVIDVTGQLGGYNLQWAWSSGFVAGQYA